ncbi:hypothetical protein [Achromobacter marplatensis]
MIKDRAQKSIALKFCVSKRWLPQLEVDVESTSRIEKSKFLLTDLDILAISTSPVGEHLKFVFDCKSGIRESGIARAFWLHGVMSKVSASHGFVVMGPKVNLSKDHRLSSSDLGISLLHDFEFGDLAQGLDGSVDISNEFSLAADIDCWDKYFNIKSKYQTLSSYIDFSRSSFWLIKDAGEQCRKTVAKLRAIRAELDPSKEEHLCIFGDAICLFLLSISNLANRLFLVLMQPADKDEFSSLLLSFLYGGYESLQAALKIRQLATGAKSDDSVSIFPDTERFEQLVREVMQVPQQALPASLLAREISLCCLNGFQVTALQKSISTESPYAPKFLLLAAEYLQKSLRLPPEFSARYADRALSLMSAK